MMYKTVCFGCHDQIHDCSCPCLNVAVEKECRALIVWTRKARKKEMEAESRHEGSERSWAGISSYHYFPQITLLCRNKA